MTTAAITDEQPHVCRLPRDQDPRNHGRIETCPTCHSEFTLTITHPRELDGRAWIAWIRTHEPEDRVSPASRETHGDETALPVRRDGGDSDTAADPSPTDSGAGVDTGEAVAAAEMSARAPVPAPLSHHTYEITVESATDYGWACHACPPERAATAVSAAIPYGADGFPTWKDAATALDDHIVEHHPEHAHLIGATS